jgi:hypothetical protein
MDHVAQKRSFRQKSKTLMWMIFWINLILFLVGFFERIFSDLSLSDDLWYLQAIEAGISWVYVFNVLNPRDWLIYLLIAGWLK